MKTSGTIRIIAGQWRHRQLPVPAHRDLRPTPDRVRETLFNWIGGSIRGSACLDMFAGSGALGFESASRGAAQVWMLERDVGLCHNLRQQCRVLDAGQVQVIQTDALTWVTGRQEAVDFIFLDPPFGEYEFETLLRRLEASGLLKPTTALYYECALATGKGMDADNESHPRALLGRWRRSHCARAGQVSYNLFQRTEFDFGVST